jgi:RHS repeat-associated protein
VLDDLHGVTSLDGGNVVLDFVDPDGTGSASLGLAKRYLYGNAVDQILAQEDVTQGISDADRVYWPLVDHLGTVRDLYQNDATSVQHYKFDSFGTVTAGNTALSRYLYAARELDPATDLIYNRARFYHPFSGRWMTDDPLGFVAADANLSAYVGNGPTVSTNPSGHEQNGTETKHIPYATPMSRAPARNYHKTPLGVFVWTEHLIDPVWIGIAYGGAQIGATMAESPKDRNEWVWAHEQVSEDWWESVHHFTDAIKNPLYLDLW